MTAAASVTVIAYGSLMSGLGLARFQTLPALHAARLRLRNCRRGFGKLSRYGNHLAMVLEPTRFDEAICAETIDGKTDETSFPEAIAFTFSTGDFIRVAEREGYRAAMARRLAELALQAGGELASYLWALLEQRDFDVAAYRHALRRVVGYTSPHYLPHPVRMPDGSAAVTFLAPGSEGSGDDSVVPVRVKSGVTGVLDMGEAWRRKPNPSQLEYFAMCVLAEAHNLCVGDVTGEGRLDADLRARLDRRVTEEIPREGERFRAILGLSRELYEQQFGRSRARPSWFSS
jgi:hypothetical protein